MVSRTGVSRETKVKRRPGVLSGPDPIQQVIRRASGQIFRERARQPFEPSLVWCVKEGHPPCTCRRERELETQRRARSGRTARVDPMPYWSHFRLRNLERLQEAGDGSPPTALGDIGDVPLGVDLRHGPRAVAPGRAHPRGFLAIVAPEAFGARRVSNGT